MLPHRVWISSRPYEARGKGGWVDKGAGFTGRINVIKYRSISRSGAEAWQIQVACGLISTRREGDATWGMLCRDNCNQMWRGAWFRLRRTAAFKVWHLTAGTFGVPWKESNIKNRTFTVLRYLTAPQLNCTRVSAQAWLQSIFLGYGVTFPWPLWRVWWDAVKLYWGE